MSDNNSCPYVSLISAGEDVPKVESVGKKPVGKKLCIIGAAVSAIILVTGGGIFYENNLYAKSALTNIPRQQCFPDIEKQFNEYIIKYNRIYASSAEKLRRLAIFTESYFSVIKHNTDNLSSFQVGINQFADLTQQERKDYYGLMSQKNSLLKSVPKKSSPISESLLHIKASDIPKNFDWRDRGCVSEVKNQSKCGSCWAFSAAGAVEGAFCAYSDKPVSLSEQQMVDCAFDEGNRGCNGGGMDEAFEYIIDNGGLCSEKDYPYEAKEGQCDSDRCDVVAKIDGFVDVPHRNATALTAAIALHGPVSVAIEADQMLFQFYKSGIFNGKCGSKLNHGVLLVGFGTTDLGEDYWILKNSWGPEWGENGFMRITRNSNQKDGECGILTECSFPVVGRKNE